MLLPRGDKFPQWEARQTYSDSRSHFDQILFTCQAFHRDTERYHDPLSSAQRNQQGPFTLAEFVNRTSADDAVLIHLNRDGATQEVSKSRSLLPRKRAYQYNRDFIYLCLQYHFKLLWIPEPAFIGDQSLVQMLMKYLPVPDVIVFSCATVKRADDPSIILPSLAYLLAKKFPLYRRFLASTLASTPSVMTKSLSTQFRQLIIEPFLHLSLPPTTIVLAEIDKCGHPDFEQEIIELIGSHVRISPDFQLHWIITSQIKPRIRRSMSNADFPFARRIDFQLATENWTSQDDAMFVLEQGFSDICRIFAHQLVPHPDWPSPHSMDVISRAVSGHPDVAIFILHFVADERSNDPRGRLDQCIQLIKSFGVPGSISPPHLLDLFYHRILSDIPPRSLPFISALIGITYLYRSSRIRLNLHHMARFLAVDKQHVSQSLSGLSPLISSPRIFFWLLPLEIQHRTFIEYFLDVRRSREHCIQDGEIHYIIASRCLKILCEAFPRTGLRQSNLDIVDLELEYYSCQNFWRACIGTPEKLVPGLIEQLKNLDFDEVNNYMHSFGLLIEGELNFPPTLCQEFYRWLYRHDPTGHWFTNKEQAPSDTQSLKRKEDDSRDNSEDTVQEHSHSGKRIRLTGSAQSSANDDGPIWEYVEATRYGRTRWHWREARRARDTEC